MKRIALYIVLMVSCSEGFSQNVFNRIVEDTAAHIMNSVITLDTGYVFLSGTRNIYNIRSFSLTYVNELGEKQWENIYGDEQNETWEGLSGNLKINNDDSYLAGTIINSIENNWGISLTRFNAYDYSTYNHYTFLNDTIWKKAFNQVFSENKNYYIVGQIFNYEYGKYRLLLLKADSIGNILWNKSFGSVYESGDKVIFSNNELLIGGETKSFPGVSSPYQKWYLLKTDTAGNIIWERAYGRSNYNNGAVKGLIETADSNYLACGSYPVARYGGGGGEYLWDGCLRKIDTDGNLIWEKHYRDYHLSHTGDTYLHNSISDLIKIENSFYILGANYDCISWKNRAYLAKLNMRGEILWKKDYYAIDTNSFSQYLVSFKPTNDKGFILAGYGNEYDLFGYDPPQQAWLVKTDSLGIDGLCYTAPPELNIDIVLPATVNCSDTITVYAYIAGKSAPYTIETSVGQVIDSIYYPPLFVPMEIGLSQAEIQYGGEIIYTQQITEATLSNHQWGQCIAKPVEFYTPHTSGSQQINITVTDAYGESKTITKEVLVNECGQSIADAEICSVNLYPNPTKEKIYLDIPTDLIPEKAEVYNSLGQLVKSVNVHSGLNVVDVSDFATGNYIIKINVVDKTYSLNFEKH